MKVFLLSGFIFILTSLGGSSGFAVEQSPRALVHMLDYLAQDYPGAIENGSIKNISEYKEQLEFVRRAAEINAHLSETKNSPEIVSEMAALAKLIQNKSSSVAVTALAQKIKAEVIDVSKLEVAPSHLPDLQHGSVLFKQNCVSCHGLTGKGDGVAAPALTPPPSNFFDENRMQELSPFQAFNAVRIGVPGTGMAPFTALSDTDVWDLAFYVISLRHAWEIGGAGVAPLPLSVLAVSSDAKLKILLTGSEQEKKRQISQLRTYSLQQNSRKSLDNARTHLREALKSYQTGSVEDAKYQALMAYLEGVEPVEPKLKSLDSAMLIKLEESMERVRAGIEARKIFVQVSGAVDAAFVELDRADGILDAAPGSPWLTFSVAAAILLREGFEAVLIIIALLGVLRAAEAKQAIQWIHGGWIAALLLGVATWIFSGWLIGISGAQRELMEGITSLLAVLVLLYMGFWLHSKTEIGRWREFIDTRVKNALEKKNLWGLAFISFTAVFREAFETVLFLRALWFEGGMASKTALLSGVLASLFVIFVFSWAFLKYATRIPIKKLFDVSSSLMTVLAVILIGKGLHSLQETGVLSSTASPVSFRIDLLGFYPTLETSLSQFLILLLALALWVYGKKPRVNTKT